MSHPPPPPEGLARDESRFLDGELPDEEARRVEARLAAEPSRAARLDAWKVSMDVWREDAARRAAGLRDPGTLVDRVLAVGGELRRAPAGARWYAAAAVLLIAVGLAGTLLVRTRTAPHGRLPAHLGSIEDAVMDLMINSPEFSPRLADAKEGR